MYIRTTFVSALFLLILLACPVFGQGISGGLESRGAILSILDAAQLVTNSFLPVDCVVKIDRTQSFEDEVTVAPTQWFRLIYDPSSEYTMQISEHAHGLVSIGQPGVQHGRKKVFGAEVIGSTVRFLPARVGSVQSYSSFGEAIGAASIYNPELWGLVKFPGGGSPNRSMALIKNVISRPGT